MERKQRKSLNPEKISTINRLMLANQSAKFIAETLDISISTVTKVIQKIYNCQESGL